MFHAVERSYWWPRLYKSVVHYVARCNACQRTKFSAASNVFAYNASVQTSTGFSPHYAVHLQHPRLPQLLDNPRLSGGGIQINAPNAPIRTIQDVKSFVSKRQSVMQQIKHNLAVTQQRQATQADRRGRSNMATLQVADQVLLHKSAIPTHAFHDSGQHNIKLRSA
ncbi:hypothetical protein AaE_008705 [Aphanomyces astaci]|uniref:Integrase zinc-binding domain-containing protein n=1 Tax=Aphanomyces astaci TaxID=112090 RepID=A0A6A5A9Z4_APHAT|nr:hypothetical protein AaE_008705 [Aphanomyces astaci]